MRLPQSSGDPLSIRLVFVALFLLASISPLYARTSQQLSSSPANLRFGSVIVAQSESQSVSLTNSGTTGVTISAISVSGSGYSVSGLNLPVVVAAGQSVSLNVIFTPTAGGWVGGSVTVSSNASNSSLKIGLHANGVTSDPLAAAPSTLSFGQVTVGSQQTSSLVLTNIGSGSETITAFQTTGSAFSVSGPTLPTTLGQGQSLTLNVTFTPKSSGLINGSVYVPGPGLNIPLTGTGSTTLGQLTVAPTSINFGNVNTGSSTTLPATISASGASVTVTSASSSSSLFSISGASFPFTLSAGQSTQLNLVFAPTNTGSASATVTLISNASNSKATESLSGTGISPQYSVNLSWNASSSPVTGYNVYRGTTSGVYSKINSSLDPTTAYTDTSVAGGMTYYYAATAVNSSGQESGYSSPIQVSIP